MWQAAEELLQQVQPSTGSGMRSRTGGRLVGHELVSRTQELASRTRLVQVHRGGGRLPLASHQHRVTNTSHEQREAARVMSVGHERARGVGSWRGAHEDEGDVEGGSYGTLLEKYQRVVSDVMLASC